MDEDTRIIIVSNLTSSAPSIHLVVLALESLVFVKGLSTAPHIYIIVDGMAVEEEPLRNKLKLLPTLPENRKRFDEYIWNLQMK